MKYTFFIILCLLSTSVFGQTVKVVDSLPVVGKTSFPIYSSLQPINKSEKGMVYQLPQDGMFALRPDTTLRKTMPVFTSKSPFLFYGPSIKKINPLFPPEKQGIRIIQTPAGPKQLTIL